SPIPAATVTTSHSRRKSETLRMLVEAMISPDSPGAMNPIPMVVSASTSTPVAVSKRGGGSDAIQLSIAVRKPTRTPTTPGSHTTRPWRPATHILAYYVRQQRTPGGAAVVPPFGWRGVSTDVSVTGHGHPPTSAFNEGQTLSCPNRPRKGGR